MFVFNAIIRWMKLIRFIRKSREHEKSMGTFTVLTTKDEIVITAHEGVLGKEEIETIRINY